MSEEKPTKAQLTEAMKVPKNHMLIEFGYSLRLVVPHEDGVKIQQALMHAEQWRSSDIKDVGHVITPFTRDDSMSFKIISNQEYLDKKMSHLFGIEVKNT